MSPLLFKLVLGLLLVGRGGDSAESVTEPDESGHPSAAPTVLFESSWNYATGTSGDALMDGPPGSRKWNDWGAQPLLEVVASGGLFGAHPGGHNALVVDQRGIQWALIYGDARWNSGHRPGVDTPQDVAIRVYIRYNASIGTQLDHGFQTHNTIYVSTWSFGVSDWHDGWRAVTGTYNDGFGWSSYDDLANGQVAVYEFGSWYRYEFLLKFQSATRFRIFTRWYAVDDATILSSAGGPMLYDWYDAGDNNGDLPPQTTMFEYYDFNRADRWLSLDEQGVQVMNSLRIGNNGQAFREDVFVDDAWMYSALKVVDGTNLTYTSPVWVGDLSGN